MNYILDLNTRVRKMGNKTILWVDNNIYELNETGQIITEMLHEEISKETILNSLLKLYPSNKYDLEQDVNEFLDFLLSINAIKEREQIGGGNL